MRDRKSQYFLIASWTLEAVVASGKFGGEGANSMLRAVVAVLLILWLLGFVLHLAGSMIHVLVVVAIAVLLYDLVTRKRKPSD